MGINPRQGPPFMKGLIKVVKEVGHCLVPPTAHPKILLAEVLKDKGKTMAIILRDVSGWCRSPPREKNVSVE